MILFTKNLNLVSLSSNLWPEEKKKIKSALLWACMAVNLFLFFFSNKLLSRSCKKFISLMNFLQINTSGAPTKVTASSANSYVTNVFISEIGTQFSFKISSHSIIKSDPYMTRTLRDVC